MSVNKIFKTDIFLSENIQISENEEYKNVGKGI